MSSKAERGAYNVQYPGDSIFIASSASATYHPIPSGWQGKYVEVVGIGCDVYLRTDPGYVAVVTTAASTVANDDDADGLLASGGASAGTAQVISGAAFNGVIDEAAISPPRRVCLVLSSHANWDATTAVVVGTSASGAVLRETLAIPDGGNATVSTTRRFASVTRLEIPAQSGTSGTFTLGVLDSNAITCAGTEPHVIAQDGVPAYFRPKSTDELFNHIESAGSALIKLTLAEGNED